MSQSTALPARALCSLAALASACADLPRVASEECGNGVVEVGEDCDTFSSDARFKCRLDGSVNACRYDCSPSVDGERAPCPDGWGCDDRGLCRAPTGQFAPSRDHAVGPVHALVSGDFDGDGRAEIISRAPRDGLGHGLIAFHFFDERGALVETRPFPKPLTAPVLLDITGDGLRDLVFSDYRVGLVPGRADRRLVPETFSSYRVPETQLRMVGVYDGFIRNATSLVAFYAEDGVPSLSAADSTTARLRRLAELPGRIEDAIADPVAGDVIEGDRSPCDELVLALRGAHSFSLFDVCELDSVQGDPVWRAQARHSEISLVPTGEIDGPARIVDMNGDDHLDVLIGAAGRAYVAYGDGAQLDPAVPYSFELTDFGRGGPVTILPLAVGDFTDDGHVDFVFEDRLVVSVPPSGVAPLRYEVSRANLGAPWTIARVADINGNGKLGVVAASSSGVGIDVFSSTRSRYPTATRLATEQPVALLDVGDFDGDLTPDIAFVEQPAPKELATRINAPEPRHALSIAYGQLGRPPSDPVPVGGLLRPEQLSVYRLVGRANMLIASSRGAPSPHGAVSLLDGAPDRLPIAPYPLVSFSDDGNLQEYPAVGMIVGAFQGPGHADVLAIGSAVDEKQLWFLSDLDSGQSTPVRLVDGTLAANLVPVTDTGRRGRLRLAGCAADLDGDGRDEGLWAIQSVDERCVLLDFDVDTRGAPALVRRGELELPAGCEDPELATFDLDGDGALDIVLLSGERAAADRELSVLWNDGSGGFSLRALTRVNDQAHQPEAFAILPRTTERARSIVYVTASAAFISGVRDGQRAFAGASEITQLNRGSGVTAADINGDGAEDLAFADGNMLRVLLAELKTP